MCIRDSAGAVGFELSVVEDQSQQVEVFAHESAANIGQPALVIQPPNHGARAGVSWLAAPAPRALDSATRAPRHGVMASLVACSCIRIFTAAIPALALSASLQTLDAAPFAEAVAVWHMSDLHDNAGADSALQTNGDVKLGVQLGDAERDESARRGGDGKAAEFHGGWFAAGHGADGELNLAGTGLTLCVRLRDPSGQWNAPLLSKHGGHALSLIH